MYCVTLDFPLWAARGYLAAVADLHRDQHHKPRTPLPRNLAEMIAQVLSAVGGSRAVTGPDQASFAPKCNSELCPEIGSKSCGRVGELGLSIESTGLIPSYRTGTHSLQIGTIGIEFSL